MADTEFHAVTASAFDRMRGMNDEECRTAELALFEVASKHLGAPDAADEVLAHLQEMPHRAFRYHALATVRALAANMKAGSKSAGDLKSVLETYLAASPDEACANLKATDMDRYQLSESSGH